MLLLDILSKRKKGEKSASGVQVRVAALEKKAAAESRRNSKKPLKAMALRGFLMRICKF